MEPTEETNMNLGEVIKNLENLKNEFSKNIDILPGFKSDMIKLSDKVLKQAINIKPFYERIEVVRKEITEPTKKSIERLFVDYKKNNESLGRSNIVLSIISIIFGVIGIVLTILLAFRL